MKTTLVVFNNPAEHVILRVVQEIGGIVQVFYCANARDLNKLPHAQYSHFLVGPERDVTPSSFARWLHKRFGGTPKALRIIVPTGDAFFDQLKAAEQLLLQQTKPRRSKGYSGHR